MSPSAERNRDDSAVASLPALWRLRRGARSEIEPQPFDVGPVLLVASGAYVAASLIANVLSVRTVRVVGFSIDAGTLSYPLTFTLRDLVHKRGGVRAARWVIVSTAAFNLMLALGVWVTAHLPADPSSPGPAQDNFGPVMAASWRIVAASLIAQVLAESVDTEVYRMWEHRFAERLQWGRVVSSNAVSVPLDSVLFVCIAFAGLWPASLIWSVIWANIVLKGAVSLVLMPLIYKIRPARVGSTRTPAPA